MPAALQNWSGNLTYRSSAVVAPTSSEAIQAWVAQADRVKGLGSRHSFNDIADTTGSHLSFTGFNRVVGLDRDSLTVTVEAGIRYGELARFLQRENYALHNLASLPHISVVGACATATHGSGEANRNLAAAVTELDLVRADGSIAHLVRGTDADFDGAVVGLGGLGVVTTMTLAIEPSYEVRQTVFENLPWTQAIDHFDAIQGSAYSVSLFTDWTREGFHQVWLKDRIDPDDRWASSGTFFGATAAATDLHPLPGHGAEHCTPQRGAVGPWHERLPHFRLEFTPSSGKELQSEYFVPRHYGCDALTAIASMREQIAPHVLVTEVRTIAGDDLWLSPCYRQPCVAIHFTWKPDWPAVAKLLPSIEQQLAPFEVRPHWGKLFTMSATDIRSRYPRFDDFRALMRRYDPHGKFRNAFLTALIDG